MEAVRFTLLSTLSLAVMACSAAGPEVRGAHGPGAKPAAIVVPIAPTSEPDSPAPAATSTSAAPHEELADWEAPSSRDSESAACKKLDALQEKATRASVQNPDNQPGFHPTASPLGCLPAGTMGAWALIAKVTGFEEDGMFVALHPGCGADDDPCVFDAEVSLTPTFVSDSGQKTVGPTLNITLYSDGSAPASAGSFDLDGDGFDELLVPGEKSTIFTLKNGKIQEYTKSHDLSFGRLVNLDSDGRPDLLLRNPYDSGLSLLQCGKRHGFPLIGIGVGVDMVARSMPDGSFSTEDARAQERAKLACPAMPAAIVARDGKGDFDLQTTLTNVACARLWGKPAKDVVDALDKGCTWAQDECTALFDLRDAQPMKECAGRDMMLTFANETPPLSLH